MCQQDKIEEERQRDYLSLSPFSKDGESIFMDFIMGLPTSEGRNWMLVVVDRYSKYTTFILALKECSTEQAAYLFFKHVVKYWDLVRSIVSDRDTTLCGNFRQSCSSLWVPSLLLCQFPSAKRSINCEVNTLLELYLRHYLMTNQKEWAELFDVGQFS